MFIIIEVVILIEMCFVAKFNLSKLLFKDSASDFIMLSHQTRKANITHSDRYLSHTFISASFYIVCFFYCLSGQLGKLPEFRLIFIILEVFLEKSAFMFTFLRAIFLKMSRKID